MPINYLIIKSISNWWHAVLFNNFLVLMSTVWDNINRFISLLQCCWYRCSVQYRTSYLLTTNNKDVKLPPWKSTSELAIDFKNVFALYKQEVFLIFQINFINVNVWHGVRKITPKKNPPLIIAPWENWPLHDCPGLLLPDNYHKDNCPPTIFSWKLPLEKIAFRIICRIHNAPRANGPEKNCPRKIVPRITYTRDIFSQESEIFVLQSLVVSCFPSL